MNKENDDSILIERIQSELDASIDDIDASTQSKITQARHRTLDQHIRKSHLRLWLPAGAAVSACVALLMFSMVSKTVVEESMLIDDFELISNMDDLELLEELEFYEWLEEYELPT